MVYRINAKQKMILAAGLTAVALFIGMVFYRSPLPLVVVPVI